MHQNKGVSQRQSGSFIRKSNQNASAVSQASNSLQSQSQGTSKNSRQRLQKSSQNQNSNNDSQIRIQNSSVIQLQQQQQHQLQGKGNQMKHSALFMSQHMQNLPNQQQQYPSKQLSGVQIGNRKSSGAQQNKTKFVGETTQFSANQTVSPDDLHRTPLGNPSSTSQLQQQMIKQAKQFGPGKNGKTRGIKNNANMAAAVGPYYNQAQQHNLRLLQETPATGSIDDLRIDIVDSQRQKREGRLQLIDPQDDDEMGEQQTRGDSRQSNHNQAHKRNVSQTVHLQLDFETNTINQQQSTERLKPVSITIDEETKMRGSFKAGSQQDGMLPLSPKINTKSQVEQKNKSSRNQQVFFRSNQQAASIDKTQLKIAMPNSTLTIMSKQIHHNNSTMAVTDKQLAPEMKKQSRQQSSSSLSQQAQDIESGRLVNNQPYAFPNQNEKRPRRGRLDHQEPSKQQNAKLLHQQSSQQRVSKQNQNAESIRQMKSGKMNNANSQLEREAATRQQLQARCTPSYHSLVNDHNNASKAREQSQTSFNNKLLLKNLTSQNRQTSNLQTLTNQNQAIKQTEAKNVQSQNQNEQFEQIGNVEKRMAALFESRMQAQQNKFMGLLERVVEGNEAIKLQMGRQISALKGKVIQLENEVYALRQDAHNAQNYICQTDITLLKESDKNLVTEPQVQQIVPSQVSQTQPQSSRRESNKPQELVVADDRNFVPLLQGGAIAACSPISAIEGIDFGKVFSTRGENTFINELIDQNKDDQIATENQVHHVSPMPKLNLSMLSDNQQQFQNSQKSLANREQEFIARINRLKQVEKSHRQQSYDQMPTSEEDAKPKDLGPKFIDQIERQMSSISRNGFNIAPPIRSETAPYLLQRAAHEQIQQETVNAGLSENVQDTQRSSAYDFRHQEFDSVGPASQVRRQEEDLQADFKALREAANEQHSMQKKLFHNVRNKRTNSLHQSRDASFLSTYNANLIAVNSSMSGNRQQFLSSNRDNAGRALQQISIQGQDDSKIFQGLKNQIISPLSAAGLNTYFSQDQSVSLRNCQTNNLNPNQMKNTNLSQQNEVNDPSEQVYDELRDPTKRIAKRINSLSASFHFNMNARDGSEIVDNEQNQHDFSPSQKKSLRQTHTSVVQHNRKVNLCQSQGPNERERGTSTNIDSNNQFNQIQGPQPGEYYNFFAENPLLPQKCVCPSYNTKPGMVESLFKQKAQNGGANFKSARVNAHIMSSQNQTPLQNIVSVERLSSANQVHEFSKSASEVTDNNIFMQLQHNNCPENNSQSDIIETIADEDAPMKVIHNELSEIKLTEIAQAPVITAAVRQTPTHLRQGLSGVMNFEPCGPYCQWLTAEAQREIIRGILTSTQGNTTLKASNGQPGDKRYLVDSVWWLKWTDYVNFDLVEVEQPSTQQEHLRQQRHKSRSTSRHYSGKKQTGQQALQNGSFNAMNTFSVNNDSLNLNDARSENHSQNQSSNTVQSQNESKQGKQSNFMDELMSLKKKGKNGNTNDSSSFHKSQPGASSTSVHSNPQQVNQAESNTIEDDDVDEESKLIDDLPIRKSVPFLKGSGATTRPRISTTMNLYARPGAIENQHLLQKRNCLQLKTNLIEHHNFVALPSQIWKHIYAWYSADWSIVRFLRRDSAQGVILELYPSNDPGQYETTHLDTDGEGASATVQ